MKYAESLKNSSDLDHLVHYRYSSYMQLLRDSPNCFPNLLDSTAA